METGINELFMEYISRIVRAELTKHNLEVAELKAAAWAKAKAIIDGIKAANDAIAIAAA